MIKWLLIIIRAVPTILIGWIKCKIMIKHKSKYSLQERYNHVRKIIKVVLKACRARLTIYNEELINNSHKGRVYIANHLAMLDIALFIATSEKPIIIISKIENKNVPFLKTYCEAIEVIYIDRNDIRQSLRICKQVGELAHNGHDILIFPEGTRSKDGNVHEFKAALSSIVHYSSSEVVPVTLANTQKLLAFRWFAYPKIPIYMKVLPTISYENYISNKKTINTTLQETLQDELNSIKEREKI